MAIYHFSMKTVSRSSGRSSTAAAAYRAGEKIMDLRTGEIHDYTKKKGVEYSQIIFPTSVEEMSRTDLWNGIEQHHKRGDALVAREFEIALPAELSEKERQRLAVDFVKVVANHYGVAADVCIHQPSKEGDERNYHAHILLTACSVTKAGFGKKVAELDPIHCQRHKLQSPAELWREYLAIMINDRLQENNIQASVDHRSLKEQGVDRLPTAHLGQSVTEMQRRRAPTEVGSRIKNEIRLSDANKVLTLIHQSKLTFETAITQLSAELLAATVERDYINEQARDKHPSRRVQPTSIDGMRAVWSCDNLHDQRLSEMLLQQDAPVDIRQPSAETPSHLDVQQSNSTPTSTGVRSRGIDPRSSYHPDNIAARAAAQVKQTEKEKDMATAKEMALVAQASAKRATNRHYSPTVEELKAVTKVVDEQIVAKTLAQNKTLGELLAGSLKAFLDWIKAKGDVMEVDTNKSEFLGPIVQSNDLHVVQKVGRSGYAVHQLSLLDKKLGLTEEIIGIKYRAGRGAVTGFLVEIGKDRKPAR